MGEFPEHEKTTLSDISVVYAAPEHAKPGSRFGPVIRSVYLVECCTGGKGSVIINGNEFPVRAGDCYVLFPKDTVVHTSDKEHPREGFWCAIDGIAIAANLEAAGITTDSPFLSPVLFNPVCQWVEKLTQEWVSRDAGAQYRQIACVFGILGTMLKNKPAKEKGTLIDMAIGLMQTHYPDDLSVAYLADNVGLERTYFSTLFKTKTGLSPYQYLTRLRIQKACQLLQQGHSVAEASYLVGIEPHNFGRVFKKEIGISPRDYKQKTRNNTNRLAARSITVNEQSTIE